MQRLCVHRKPHHKKREKASGSSRSNPHTRITKRTKPTQQAGSRKQVARGLRKQAAGIMQMTKHNRKNILRPVAPSYLSTCKQQDPPREFTTVQPAAKKTSQRQSEEAEKRNKQLSGGNTDIKRQPVAAGSQRQGASSQDFCNGWGSQRCHHTLLLQFSAPLSE